MLETNTSTSVDFRVLNWQGFFSFSHFISHLSIAEKNEGSRVFSPDVSQVKKVLNSHFLYNGSQNVVCTMQLKIVHKGTYLSNNITLDFVLTQVVFESFTI